VAIYKITNNTDPNALIGRYVMKDSGMLYPSFGQAGKVFSITGKTATIEEVVQYWLPAERRYTTLPDHPGIESDSPRTRGGDVFKSQIRSLDIACDTLLEVEHIKIVSHANGEKYDETLRQMRAEFNAQFDQSPMTPAVASMKMAP
jgi:hypothetical protein